MAERKSNPECPIACSFRQICVYCGCVFRVDVTRSALYSYKSNLYAQSYRCPECDRDSRVRTMTEPVLTLVSKRTDGRTERCPTL